MRNQILLSEARELTGVYAEGLNLLYRARVIDILRQAGKPIIIENGKDPHVMATQAAYATGWHDCLNCLEDFVGTFLVEKNTKLEPDYGATDAALQKGDLTKEDVDALTRDGHADYTAQFKRVNEWKLRRAEHLAHKQSNGRSEPVKP